MRRGIVRARTLFRMVILGRVSNDSFGSFETRPKMTHGVSAVPQPTSLKPMPQTVLM